MAYSVYILTRKSLGRLVRTLVAGDSKSLCALRTGLGWCWREKTLRNQPTSLPDP